MIDHTKMLPALKQIAAMIEEQDTDGKIAAINDIREFFHALSPMKDEPVDYVKWVHAGDVYANDYNPNAVAPPEMELLARSIMNDGFTQPIVTWETEDGREVIDGFHRNRVGKENMDVNTRLMGYLPVVGIKQVCEGRNDRIASTIRHNRARGKHKIDAMSEIVVELRRRNWSPKKVGKELGMDPDEVLRLCQVSGLREMFADASFSEAWEADQSEPNMASILEVGRNEVANVEVSEKQEGSAPDGN